MRILSNGHGVEDVKREGISRFSYSNRFDNKLHIGISKHFSLWNESEITAFMESSGSESIGKSSK
jgi:hypothetical protein